MHFIKLSFSLILFSAIASAVPVVECKSSEVAVIIDHSVKEVYVVTYQFPSGLKMKFQTNGVIRSDRGFATMGIRGVVYQKDSSGALAGWAAEGNLIFKDLDCTYLN